MLVGLPLSARCAAGPAGAHSVAVQSSRRHAGTAPEAPRRPFCSAGAERRRRSRAESGRRTTRLCRPAGRAARERGSARRSPGAGGQRARRCCRRPGAAAMEAFSVSGRARGRGARGVGRAFPDRRPSLRRVPPWSSPWPRWPRRCCCCCCSEGRDGGRAARSRCGTRRPNTRCR